MTTPAISPTAPRGKVDLMLDVEAELDNTAYNIKASTPRGLGPSGESCNLTFRTHNAESVCCEVLRSKA